MSKQDYLVEYCANKKCFRENCDLCMYDKGRTDAINECIKIVESEKWYYSIIAKLEKLKGDNREND